MESSTHHDGTIAAARALALRQCLGHFATGVAVATCEHAGRGPKGLTINSFTSVSMDPPLVLVCLDRRSRAMDFLPGSAFAVNVLGAHQQQLAWLFAGRPSDAVPAWRYLRGVPVLDHCLAWMTCSPWSTYEAGDHVIMVGYVQQFGSGQQEPLCFYRGKFTGLASAAPVAGEQVREIAG